eukprot:363883-Chlamydomonas_euryale.AAC.2
MGGARPTARTSPRRTPGPLGSAHPTPYPHIHTPMEAPTPFSQSSPAAPPPRPTAQIALCRTQGLLQSLECRRQPPLAPRAGSGSGG